jgi:hypothetical protein
MLRPGTPTSQGNHICSHAICGVMRFRRDDRWRAARTLPQGQSDRGLATTAQRALTGAPSLHALALRREAPNRDGAIDFNRQQAPSSFWPMQFDRRKAARRSSTTEFDRLIAVGRSSSIGASLSLTGRPSDLARTRRSVTVRPSGLWGEGRSLTGRPSGLVGEEAIGDGSTVRPP